MKPTAKQVAHVAGVSLAAVSRAFRPGSALDQAKRQRILTVAAELGYVSPARRMAETFSAGTISLIAGDLANPFYPMVLEVLARQLQLTRRQLLVYALPADANVDDMTTQVLAVRPSAVIVTSAWLTSRMAGACREQGIKVVLLNRIQRDIRINAVSCDNYAGGRDAARHLLHIGRRRIGFIAGVTNTSTHVERERGFREMLDEAGRGVFATAEGAFKYRVAHEAATSLLAGGNPPDALFCCNDIMALAAIDAAKGLGMRVPDDVAIIGFDDIPMASWNSYRLTTIRQPVDWMAQETIKLIDERADTSTREGSTRILPGELVRRSSA